MKNLKGSSRNIQLSFVKDQSDSGPIFNEENVSQCKNLMFDHRVARGNTYALNVKTETDQRNEYVIKRNKAYQINREHERQRKMNEKVFTKNSAYLSY